MMPFRCDYNSNPDGHRDEYEVSMCRPEACWIIVHKKGEHAYIYFAF
jgi:hypothetical protein